MAARRPGHRAGSGHDDAETTYLRQLGLSEHKCVRNVEHHVNGNRSLVLAVPGLIEEVTPEGLPVWSLALPGGWSYGFALREASLYPSGTSSITALGRSINEP